MKEENNEIQNEALNIVNEELLPVENEVEKPVENEVVEVVEVAEPVEIAVEEVEKPVENEVEEVVEVAEPVEIAVEEVEKPIENEVEEVEKPVEIAVEEVEKPIENEVETVEEPVEIAEQELLPVENEIEEAEEVVEVEDTEHQAVLLNDDVQEESTDISGEVAADFDKELLSAKDHSVQHEEESEYTEKEVEIIPDYQSYEPEALIEALEALLQEESFESIKGRVSAIKLAFLEHEKAARMAAKTAEDANEDTEKTEEFVFPLSERFNAVFDVYRQKKAKFTETLEKEKEANFEKKNIILEELRTLLVSEQPLKVTYDRFRELQEQWKSIGLVPKQEIASLWNNYHFLIEKFFDKVRIHRELKELDLKKNLELKIALCEKTEELLLEEKVIDAFKKLQEYHKQWNEIGAVSNTHRVEIWERFKVVSDTINQRHRDFFEALRSEYESNAQAKTAICEKVEEITTQTPATINEWNQKTDEINELFKLWKSIGATGRKQSEELWTRFKKTMDAFYKSKKEFYQKIKDLSMDNYNKKLNLCVEAEALQDSTDWKDTTKEFLRLQDEWKKIGPVPSKLSEKIHTRFRAACNHFFNSKSAYFSNVSAAEPINLKAKEDLIEELKNCDFSGMRAENIDKLKDFQRRWLSIGFVPFKEKERLQTEYRQVLNEKMKQLNISFFEMNEGRAYRDDVNSNYSAARRNDGSETGIRKEIIFLQNKVATMQDEINLWENNIGFLASSKNADILKQEFEKKIQKAKNDLELNVARLRLLRQELDKQDKEREDSKPNAKK